MRLLRGKKKDDQAGRLRKLVTSGQASAAVGLPRTVVVLGAKGGVGATTVCWRLTQSLVAAGSAPLAIDGHLWQPDLARTAGLASANGASLADVVTGESPAIDAVRVNDGPAVLPGDWTTVPTDSGANLGEDLQTLVAPELAERFDTLVVDGGPSRTPWAASLCKTADLLLLVTTPGELAVLGAYSLVKQIATNGDAPPIRLVINHCQNEANGRATHARLRDACREHLDASVLLAGWLPSDARMAVRDEPPVPLLRPLARRVREALAKEQPQTPAAEAA